MRASGNRLPGLEMRAACFGGPGNRLLGCVIDYTEEHATGNRLPEMKSLKIPLLLACSGYETHCVAA